MFIGPSSAAHEQDYDPDVAQRIGHFRGDDLKLSFVADTLKVVSVRYDAAMGGYDDHL